MRTFTWSIAKNEQLKRTRGVSFEEILASELIDIRHHPKRKNQNIMLFRREGYVWVVPFVEQGDDIFMKTLYPSRQYTKLLQKKET